MSRYDYDLFVIGAGSGGVRAARRASAYGVKVAIAENRHVGGTCVNVGCVPKKLFVYASEFAEHFRAAGGFGWRNDNPQFDWRQLMAQKNQEISRLQAIYKHLLEQAGVILFEGNACLLNEHTVAVDGKTFKCRKILIATGGQAAIPDIPGKEHGLTSDALFFLTELPKRMMIVGGGYIAVEFAGIMHGLGVEVTLCYHGNQLLRHFDHAIGPFLADQMQQKGISLVLNTEIVEIVQTESGYAAKSNQGVDFETDAILFATGRVPNTNGLGLKKAGVELSENGAVMVDQHYQSNIASIYALGDVTDRYMLTPVATAEAMALVEHLYNASHAVLDYKNIPTAVFSQPNVATVGMTEMQARTMHDDVIIYQSIFTPMKHTLSGSNEKTLMKLVVRKSSDEVLGVHMVGPDAGEIIQGMAIALRAGATKSIFDSTIGIHPTAAEEFVTMREAISH